MSMVCGYGSGFCRPQCAGTNPCTRSARMAAAAAGPALTPRPAPRQCPAGFHHPFRTPYRGAWNGPASPMRCDCAPTGQAAVALHAKSQSLWLRHGTAFGRVTWRDAMRCNRRPNPARALPSQPYSLAGAGDRACNKYALTCRRIFRRCVARSPFMRRATKTIKKE